MAPRRGGGGGGIKISSAAIKKCQSNNAFSTTEPRLIISFVAVYFVVICVIFYLFARRRPSESQAWIPLGMSLFLGLVHLLIDLITVPVYECGSMALAAFDASQHAVMWLNIFAVFFLVAAIMIPVCKTILQVPSRVTMFNTIFIGILGAVTFVTLGIGVSRDNEGSSDNSSLAKAENAVVIARDALVALGTTFASIIMIRSMINYSHLREGGNATSVMLLICSSLALSILHLVVYLRSTYSTSSMVTLTVVQFILERLLFIVAWLSSCYIITAPEITGNKKYGYTPPVAFKR